MGAAGEVDFSGVAKKDWSVPGHRKLLRWIRLFALFLGLILPVFLLGTAYMALGDLNKLSAYDDISDIASKLPKPMQGFDSPNDYAFLLVAHLEAGSQHVMLNKHRMKVAVINIGFAVACVGLVVLILGIDGGGLELAVEHAVAGNVNFKVASSGVAIFVLGACMSAAGGLLPNPYTTVGVPSFVSKETSLASTSADELKERLKNLLPLCKSNVDNEAVCIANAVETALSRKQVE